ncbi:hypothetical protein, partial [Propionibacterium freudenreichii]|uniref:hypothetical protein n=1 Tax=Propionibacterium freudenreichii TaxID=1744 RepID=UPI003853198D
KNSEQRLADIQNEIKTVLQLSIAAQSQLAEMATAKITLNEAERAFLGLITLGNTKPELTQTGRTRLENRLEAYRGAFM